MERSEKALKIEKIQFLHFRAHLRGRFKSSFAIPSTAKRIVVICDNARYYRSNLVREFLKKSRVEIKFLPPYAPNLNLIERLWRFMNKKIRNNKYYEKFSEFEFAVFGFFEQIGLYRDQLTSLLTENFRVA